MVLLVGRRVEVEGLEDRVDERLGLEADLQAGVQSQLGGGGQRGGVSGTLREDPGPPLSEPEYEVWA